MHRRSCISSGFPEATVLLAAIRKNKAAATAALALPVPGVSEGANKMGSVGRSAN
jgi:hypothetical protein